MRKMSDTWIVIPAYNEGPVIGNVLADLIQFPYHIVLVDDGSSDCTVQEALKYPITVLQHFSNLGQGAALQTGISYALRFDEVRYILTFDADGQHRSEDIPRLLEPLQNGTSDVVLGSRFMEGGSVVNIGASRLFMLRLAVIFTKITTGLSLTDTHNGFRAFTVQSASKIRITQNGMAHASEILHQIAKYKLRYCEVPVTITYTQYSTLKGQSIWNGINILWDILTGGFR